MSTSTEQICNALSVRLIEDWETINNKSYIIIEMCDRKALVGQLEKFKAKGIKHAFVGKDQIAIYDGDAEQISNYIWNETSED